MAEVCTWALREILYVFNSRPSNSCTYLHDHRCKSDERSMNSCTNIDLLKGPEKILPAFEIEFETAILAETVLYSFIGVNSVYEHKTSNGTSLALKIRTADRYPRSNAEMMHYAATHGILAPKVRGIYDVQGKHGTLRVVVSEKVPGQTIDEVWQTMSTSEQDDVKRQLREQLQLMAPMYPPIHWSPRRTTDTQPLRDRQRGSLRSVPQRRGVREVVSWQNKASAAATITMSRGFEATEEGAYEIGPDAR